MTVLRTILFLSFAIVAPGVAIQRLLRLRSDPALVIPVGTAFAAGAYWLSLVSGAPLLFPLLTAVACVGLLPTFGPWTFAPGPSLRGAVPPGLVLVLLLAAAQFPWNRVGPTGEFLLDPLVPFDTAFHVGLTRELAMGYPPQVPGVAGMPLGYHLGPDLVRAAALRWARVDPYDALSRIDVTVGALALVLALRAIALRLRLPPLAVTLAPWTLLASDFSFVFAGNPSAVWWADILRGNLLVSLFLANPIVPALCLTLGAVVALSRHLEGEGRGWIVLAALLALAVPFFKVFLGAHLLLGLGVAWLLSPAARIPVLIAAAPCAVATLLLATGQGGQTVAVTFAPLDLVHLTRASLELPPLSGARLLAWSGFWLAASLGLRAAGLRPALAALRQGAVPAALAAMALAAWPLGLMFRVAAPEMLQGQKVVNDAAYLVEQGGPLLWLFALGGLAALPLRTPLLLGALAVLSLPSTVQFVVRKTTTPPDRVPAAMVRAVRALEHVSSPGEVILQRPGARYPALPVVLASRRVAYERFTPWLTQFAPAAVLAARHEAVFRFFRTGDPAEARRIAGSLGARFVCLYGSDRVRFPTDGMLLPIHDEPGARCYTISPSAARPDLGQHQDHDREQAQGR